MTANRVLVISRHAIQGEAMRKFYRYLKRLGTVAGAVRQIVLTVLLVCNMSQNVGMIEHPATLIQGPIIKI